MKNLRFGLGVLCLFFLLLSFNTCSFITEIFHPPCQECPNVPCEDISDLDNVDSDSLGYYKQGEVVLSFPQKTDMIDSTGVPIDTNYIKFKVDSFYRVINRIPPTDNNDTIDISIIKCICDDNIFLIKGDTLIGGETNVAEAANNDEEIRREGGIFSLNYIVDLDKTEIPAGIVSAIPPIHVQGEFNTDTSNLIVAFLDSGIDFTKFPDKSGIYKKTSVEDTICTISDDQYGYNFIDEGSPNADIHDLNGHGTLAKLAYKATLDKLDNIKWYQQRLLTVRVLDKCGNGTIFSTTCGLSYARQKNANIINCSWGLYFNDYQIQRAIDQIPDDVLIVCSAGNSTMPLDNYDPELLHFPSGYSFNFQAENLPALTPPLFPSTELVSGVENINVFEVMALDHELNYPCSPPIISNYIFAGYTNKRNASFAEPADQVQTLIPDNPCPCNPINGTSFAAPAMSAGLVYLDANPPPGITRPFNRINVSGISFPIPGSTNKCYTRSVCN